MRALVSEGPGHVELRELPEPEPGPGEVVVRVEATLTCGTDLKLVRRGHPKVPFPTVLGHEFCGRISRVGPGVPFAVGERVTSAVTGACGECRDCREGHPNLCGTAFDHRVWGTWAEFVRVPARIVDRGLLRVPGNLSPRSAALLDPLASVLRGLSRIGDIAGKTALVLGAGPIALLFTILLRRRGAGRILVAGRNAGRLAAHTAEGAETIMSGEGLVERVLGLTDGRGSDLVIEATGAPSVAEDAPVLAARGGIVLLFAGLAHETRLAVLAHRIHYDEVSLVGSFHYTPAEAREALGILARGEIPTEHLVTGESPLEGHAAVFARIAGGDDMKVAFLP
jgi:L-iditol 2-dehydrogenase